MSQRMRGCGEERRVWDGKGLDVWEAVPSQEILGMRGASCVLFEDSQATSEILHDPVSKVFVPVRYLVAVQGEHITWSTPILPHVCNRDSSRRLCKC